MASSKSFFGTRRGSTKSHTYAPFRGQQVTKDRVGKPRNPQTAAQIRQRMIVRLCQNAASQLRPLISQSFEGVPRGEASVREFLRVNQRKGALNPSFWAKKESKSCGVANYQISRGRLFSPQLVNYNEEDDQYPYSTAVSSVPLSMDINPESEEFAIDTIRLLLGLSSAGRFVVPVLYSPVDYTKDTLETSVAFADFSSVTVNADVDSEYTHVTVRDVRTGVNILYNVTTDPDTGQYLLSDFQIDLTSTVLYVCFSPCFFLTDVVNGKHLCNTAVMAPHDMSIFANYDICKATYIVSNGASDRYLNGGNDVTGIS